MFKQIQATIILVLLLSIFMAFSVNAAEVKLYTKNNILVAANQNDGLSSSDISLQVQIEVNGKIVVDEGHEVKYLAPDRDERKKKMPALHEPKFDDSKWEDGISGVGYDDGDDNTEIPGGDVAVIYTRYRFDVPKASSAKKIITRADYDDGYLLWLNGVEIARSPNLEVISKVGEIPDWDLTAPRGKMQNHGATQLPKGNPNKGRWGDAKIAVVEVDVTFGGTDGLPVEPRGKLTTTWGQLKSSLNHF
ncbi:hypothetical protein IH992_26970 [Candidatus Poribacteria bacterium]|nr:hypothetical protein [Candidatus Poribacteria bacterium]